MYIFIKKNCGYYDLQSPLLLAEKTQDITFDMTNVIYFDV